MVDAKTSSSSSPETVDSASQKNTSSPETVDSASQKNTTSTSLGKLSASLFAFLEQGKLLSWLGELTKAPATIYDKALDMEYLKTFIGGGNHRLFDGGHDLLSAWQRVKEASPDDTFQQEVLGYISALWKDVTTVKGLPFATISKDSFEAWVGALDWIPGVDRKYVYDLLSFDAMEILSSALGAVGVLFALNKEDEKMLSELLGSMGIISITSANPIMGIFAIGTAAYAYKRKDMEINKTIMGKSAAVSALATVLFGVLGLPLLFNLLVVIVITQLFRQQVLDNEQLHTFVKENIIDQCKEKTEEIYAEIRSLMSKGSTDSQAA